MRSATPPSHRGDGRSALAFLTPGLVGLVAFTLFPIVMALVMSFNDWSVFGEHRFIGLGNYRELFGDRLFRAALLNTLLFAVMLVPMSLFVSLGLALWISPKVRGRQAFRVLFFIPTVTPIVANVFVWRLVFEPGGPLDSLWNTLFGSDAPGFLTSTTLALPTLVVVTVWQTFGLMFLIFSAAIDQVPTELLEAAALDGAGRLRSLWHVTLPAISPTIFFTMIVGLIGAFQVFAQPQLLTGGGPGTATETVVLNIYRTGWRSLEMGLAAAGGWILFMIILGLTALQFAGHRKWVHYGD